MLELFFYLIESASKHVQYQRTMVCFNPIMTEGSSNLYKQILHQAFSITDRSVIDELMNRHGYSYQISADMSATSILTQPGMVDAIYGKNIPTFDIRWS